MTILKEIINLIPYEYKFIICFSFIVNFSYATLQIPNISTVHFSLSLMFFSGSEASWGDAAGSFCRRGGGHRAPGAGLVRYGLGLGSWRRGGLCGTAGVWGAEGSHRGGVSPPTPGCSARLDTGSEEEEHAEEAQIDCTAGNFFLLDN